MNEERAKRKLTAIFSADVKGYSRLMGEDELSTVRTLENYRVVIASFIEKFRGRVVDSPGDNVLAEFLSVVDAVEASVQIQKTLHEKNVELPVNRRMEFRIGINLGDVIEGNGCIYGDGVNIAARIEGLAEPGGVCISKTAFDQVKNKLKLGYAYLGDHQVKNITDPVKAFKVLTDPDDIGKVIDGHGKPWRPFWVVLAVFIALIIGATGWHLNHHQPTKIGPTFSSKTAGDIPAEPSIAVLPFNNLTGDSTQDFLGDGMSEDIINALSKIPKLIVIARQSTFSYKGKTITAQGIGKDLDVRYILEGNVRKADDRIRVSAQLVDAATGKTMWADTYDGQIVDFFTMQEEITFNIITALQIKLTEGFQAKLWAKKAGNLKAYAKLMQGVERLRKFNKEDNRLARELAQEALTLDPEYAGAFRVIGWTHLHDARFGFSESSALSMNTAMEMAHKAIAIDDQDPGIFYLLAGIHLFRKEHDLAVINIRKASEMDPNGADILGYKALCLNYAGEPSEALTSIQRAKRLNPRYPSWYDTQEGLSYHLLGDHQKSLEAYLKARERTPGTYLNRAMLVICYVYLGREIEAKTEAQELLKIKSDFTMKTWIGVQPYKDRMILENEMAALQKVGLK